jgi:hypothetical protein
MARYVVLEFDDNNAAEQFVAFHQMHERDEAVQALLGLALSKVVALIAKPTMFCTCTSVKKRGWVRGKKWGWYVCNQCGKPSRPETEEKLLRHVVSQARNLLTQPLVDPPVVAADNYPPSDVASIWDEGWGAGSKGRLW